MRFSEILSELFDPKLAMPLQWEVSPGSVYAYGQVKTKHGDVSIDITFAEIDKGMWNIEFMVGGSFEVTGGGGSSQVFATVIEGVKKFLTKVKDVYSITFTAEEKSRAKAYDTIAKRVARGLGWHVVPHEDLVQDPKYGLLRSYGAFAFAIEKGAAPEHRQAAQKPAHGQWVTSYYVYSFEFPELAAIKIRAKDGNVAEMYVRRNVPEYKNADPMGIFASKNPPEGRKVVDMGEVPAEPPKPAPRVLTPLEQQLRDRLSEVNFGGQEVEGNPLVQFKEKFPNLSTVLYFIPGFGQAFLAADLASQAQMYNQAMDQIAKKYPIQTIQAVQQQVGDDDDIDTSNWEQLNESK